MTITNWEITNQDYDSLMKVVDRALAELTDYPDDKRTLVMDLWACHANACPIDFEGLAAASLGDLSHDVTGIRTHINRRTGALDENGHGFVPRYALSNRVSEVGN